MIVSGASALPSTCSSGPISGWSVCAVCIAAAGLCGPLAAAAAELPTIVSTEPDATGVEPGLSGADLWLAK